LIGVREAAKSLGLQQNAFVQMLIGAKIMYRENGHLQSYQSNIDSGRFVVKVVTDASGKARSRTMLTAKGIRWVAQKLELDKLFGADWIL
jgi:phage antirepressor YoqD-like protein